ncbi:hypothetical protein HBB16_05020 [Pseudonocardia sp. MCCB 268]|nr:hypothetical protein [Pseudonocardia cytotoxica]
MEEIGAPPPDSAGDGEGRSRAELASEWLVEGREPSRSRIGGPRSGRRRRPAVRHLWAAGDRPGPYESHPDRQRGRLHAEACARHRADVRAWVRRTGWEDDQ